MRKEDKLRLIQLGIGKGFFDHEIEDIANGPNQ